MYVLLKFWQHYLVSNLANLVAQEWLLKAGGGGFDKAKQKKCTLYLLKCLGQNGGLEI